MGLRPVYASGNQQNNNKWIPHRSKFLILSGLLIYIQLYFVRTWKLLPHPDGVLNKITPTTEKNLNWSAVAPVFTKTPDRETSIEDTSISHDKINAHIIPKSDKNFNHNVCHYHDYAVFIVHYHKTGFFLSRELISLVHDMEMMVHEKRKAQRRNQAKQNLDGEQNTTHEQQQDQHQNQTLIKYEFHLNLTSTSREKYDHISFEKSGLDPTNPNQRIAFDQFGNWARSAFQARQHDPTTSCPTGLGLEPGVLYVQESPDLFCPNDVLLHSFVGNNNSDSWIRYFRAGGARGNNKESRLKRRENLKLIRRLNKDKPGRVKIIHLVRNPFDMVLSNYLYHSQDPTPEKWVHDDDPCQEVYEDGITLASHVLMTLASEFQNHSMAVSGGTLQQNLAKIVAMCHSLYQSNQSTKNKTFYEHLKYFSEWDGLRLASAQMIASSGVANKHLAGGDVLRMANNLVRFSNLLEERGDKDVQLLTLSTDDFISNTAENTMKFMDFIFGDDRVDNADSYGEPTIPRNVRWEASKHQEAKFSWAKENSTHVTTKVKRRGEKEELKEKLRRSPELGPILSRIEVLVNQALMAGQ